MNFGIRLMMGIAATLLLLWLSANLVGCEKTPAPKTELPATQESLPVLTDYYLHYRQHGDECVYWIGAVQYNSNQLAVNEEEFTTKDPKQYVFGYDTSVVTLTERTIIPKRIGSTVLCLKNPEEPSQLADSIRIVVKRRAGRLYVE